MSDLEDRVIEEIYGLGVGVEAATALAGRVLRLVQDTINVSIGEAA